MNMIYLLGMMLIQGDILCGFTLKLVIQRKVENINLIYVIFAKIKHYIVEYLYIIKFLGDASLYIIYQFKIIIEQKLGTIRRKFSLLIKKIKILIFRQSVLYFLLNKSDTKFNCLSFEFSTMYLDDIIYMAYSVPYTYS